MDWNSINPSANLVLFKQLIASFFKLCFQCISLPTGGPLRILSCCIYGVACNDNYMARHDKHPPDVMIRFVPYNSIMEANKNVSTRDIVMAYFAALQQRDLSAVVKLFADVVDWDIPGHAGLAPWLGKRRTRAEIEVFFNLLWRSTEAVSGSVDHLLVEGNVALTSGRFASRMLQTGKVYESMFFTEIVVERGLIVRYRLLEEGYGLVLALTM